MRKVIVSYLLLIFLLTGCNMNGSQIILDNNTDYTVIVSYRDGTNGDGSIRTEEAQISPNSEKELNNVETWQNGGVEEFQIEGFYAVNGPDLDCDQTPGTLFTPLLVVFTVK